MSIAPQRPFMSVSGTRNAAVSFSDMLDVGELLTGTPTILEVANTGSPNTDLTLANKAVSTTELTINDKTVPIGEAVQFNVVGGTVANSPYSITITVDTDATPAQVLIGTVVLTVIADA